ncbi:MAG TPA: hypothetical protein PKM63_12525 [Panacibacter sp.]|nr:hypothetical protein [Panacibacter sp.]
MLPRRVAVSAASLEKDAAASLQHILPTNRNYRYLPRRVSDSLILAQVSDLCRLVTYLLISSSSTY